MRLNAHVAAIEIPGLNLYLAVKDELPWSEMIASGPGYFVDEDALAGLLNLDDDQQVAIEGGLTLWRTVPEQPFDVLEIFIGEIGPHFVDFLIVTKDADGKRRRLRTIHSGEYTIRAFWEPVSEVD